MDLIGIHHLTAVSADIRGNRNFYTDVLGMRLVKRSVNQDDVSAYHLFYADGAGSPGTDLTFFDWKVPSERRGAHVVTRTHLRVADPEALAWWDARLRERGVEHTGIVERDGRALIDFEDPEGQRLSLVADGGAGDDPVPWEDSPVPVPKQIRGLGPIQATAPDPAPTEAVLKSVLNMRYARSYEHDGREVRVHEMGAGGPHAELHLDVAPDMPVARPGAGGVHHVAFRIPDDAYESWAERLSRSGVPNSGPVDRYWFRSLYFREPNGVLFELATDGPGFAVDEDPEHLGETVVLPPFLEGRRDEIVAGLTPLD